MGALRERAGAPSHGKLALSWRGIKTASTGEGAGAGDRAQNAGETLYGAARAPTPEKHYSARVVLLFSEQ